MAKRSSTVKRTKPAGATTGSSTSPSTNALERQVLAFAEQLGYVAGSIQAKSEGLMDRETLSRQVTSVRDGAKRLLDQIASGVATRVRRRRTPAKPVRKARSGGMVDAPGKKHRKPAPAGPPESAARSRNARVSPVTPTARSLTHRARQG
jgi:hypothetical protein